MMKFKNTLIIFLGIIAIIFAGCKEKKATHESSAAGKGVAGNITMVFAAFALQLFGFIMSQILEIIDGS